MTRDEYCVMIEETLEAIDFKGKYVTHERYGDGHINDTFLLIFRQNDNSLVKYILQRINHQVFHNPDQLMLNISRVTSFLREKIETLHGDVSRETLNIINTKKGEPYFKDSIGSYWRAFQFITDSTSFSRVEKPEDFYHSAVAFGHFQYLLANFDANTLYETIPDFHNTPVRFQAFKRVITEDICNRVKEVEPEIDFIKAREQDMNVCRDLLKKGKLLLRVTHNDTKLNNVMIDNATGRGLCVIDLDTVMPGFSINDFGDSIRFGANTATEDEIDLSKVSLDLELFELYTKGYFEGCNGCMLEEEITMLPMGAKLMTLECGMRFLTDYLQGDIYFNIHREGQNLDRCRTQLKLVESMEQKWEEMRNIIDKYRYLC